jgi:uncharacterized protein YcbX
MPSLSAIFIYPVKSAAGITLQSVALDRFGPAGDRRWMLVDESGRFVSQREAPELARLAVGPAEAGLALRLGSAFCTVAVPVEGGTSEVQIWEDRVRAVDAGDGAAAWLTRRLGRTLRLVYMPDASYRYVDGRYASSGETVSFADGFPLLLVSASALDRLNEKLSTPVGLDRFRPNLIVSGCEPHAEDSWRRIRIGELEFDVAKPCARCVVPSINQQTGEKDSEILRVLASYRRGEDRQVYFGQNLVYQQTGRLAVGDPVEVLA